MDFKNYRFRASQAHILMTGTIGLTDVQKAKMEDYIARKKASKNGELVDGKPVKPLTQNMEEDLKNLLLIHESQDLPKTIISELKKIYRAEKYNRNFVWTNKYVQKGILQEEEAITLYQEYRKKILGINTFFTKNTERISNDYFTGEWDLPTLPEIKKTKEGFDIKNSWSLDTFPFDDEELSVNYFWQNQVYMDLTGAEQWTTVFCLVNGTEHLVNNEKLKHFYALNMPSEGDKYYEEYLQKRLDVEKMMIFDYDRFVHVNPYHDMDHNTKEWNFDIPLKDRVIEKVVKRDENAIKELKNRVKTARKWLNLKN